MSKPGREVTSAHVSQPLSAEAADEGSVVEGTDVTMGTSSEDERASPELHTAAPPRPHTGVESSDDELAGEVTSEHSLISAPISDNVSLACPWVGISDL